MAIKFLEGKLTLETTGVPNRESTGRLTGQRLKLLKTEFSGDLSEVGNNHVKAKVDVNGKSFTSGNCINQEMMKRFIPKINASEVCNDEKMCSSIFHLLNGNVRTAGGSKTHSYQRSKALKIGDAYDIESGQVFIESKVNNTLTTDSNGLRTQETASKRLQEADVCFDISNLSVFLFEDGDASVKHCPSDPKVIESVLEGLRNLFLSEGIKDVSNIRSDYRVTSRECVNLISFRGILFTKEQILMLLKKGDYLLRSVRKFTTHGNFKVKSLEWFDQDGRSVDLNNLTPEDLELDHIALLEEGKRKEKKVA